ncbi:MAG: hypothetical protein HY744_29570 [Deltaproteobacteria bacterium]|nr:hypothetical protein [Deltaproteobacteria bacterium]
MCSSALAWAQAGGIPPAPVPEGQPPAEQPAPTAAPAPGSATPAPAPAPTGAPPPEGWAPAAAGTAAPGGVEAGKPPEPKGEEAKEEGEEKEKPFVQGGQHRRVNQHNFIPPDQINSPFLNSNIGLAQGFGVYQFQAPDYTLDAIIKAIQNQDANWEKKLSISAHHFLMYGQALSGQIGILNRVSLDLSVMGRAAVGGETDTAIVMGGLGMADAGGMAKVRIVTVDKIGLQVTAGVGAGYHHILRVLPMPLVLEAICNYAGKNCGLEGFVSISEMATVTPALMATLGWKPLGLQFSVEPVFGVAGADAEGNFEPTQTLATGVQLEVDFAELSEWAPVAIAGGYRIDYELSAKDASYADTHGLSGGIFYSGRRDFLLGLRANVSLITPSQEAAPMMVTGLMQMQYYF